MDDLPSVGAQRWIESLGTGCWFQLQPVDGKASQRCKLAAIISFSGKYIFVNRNGLRWRDAPKDYGPHKTLYNRWKRWGDKGVFLRIMEGLAAPQASERKTVMIDATYLKAHRTASSLAVKKGMRAA